jgi:GrpB-like predicted nucleotidyltransferase (UPF0157 family)
MTDRLPTRSQRADVNEPEVFGSSPKQPIYLSDYDPSWVFRFEAEKARISEALMSTPHSVEHIGSTAVPGLAAKPIVDVLVTVADITDEDGYVRPLVAVGYELRRREPGHRLLRTPEHEVNIHVLEVGDPAADDFLLFRDHLRRDSADRERYEQAKRVLAERDWHTRNDYADAKTDVIESIKARARLAQ